MERQPSAPTPPRRPRVISKVGPTLPHLVGDSPVVEIRLGGRRLPAWLDSGSQVTTIEEPCFNQCFPGHPLETEVPWLSLQAANKSPMEVVGIAWLDIEYAGQCLPARGVVVIDSGTDVNVPVILGMNVIPDLDLPKMGKWKCFSVPAHLSRERSPSPGIQGSVGTSPPTPRRFPSPGENLAPPRTPRTRENSPTSPGRVHTWKPPAGIIRAPRKEPIIVPAQQEVELPNWWDLAPHRAKQRREPEVPIVHQIQLLTGEDWGRSQLDDAIMSQVHFLVKEQHYPGREVRNALSPEVRRVLRQWDRLRIRDGVLMKRLVAKGRIAPQWQVVVSQAMAYKIVEKVHHQMGHWGPDRLGHWLSPRFYCNNLGAVIHQVCQACRTCHQAKGAEVRVPPLEWKTHRPLQVVQVDFLTLDTARDGYSHALVMVDHFSKFAVVTPTKDQTAYTAATVFCRDFIRPYGCPETVHSDQGPAFEAALFDQLCRLYKIKKTRSFPYYPQGNGACERFNRTLIQLLRTLQKEKREVWPAYVAELVWTYNHSVHTTTKMTPYYVLFGLEGRGPLEVAFGIPTQEEQWTPETWVDKHQQRLEVVGQLALQQEEAEVTGSPPEKKAWVLDPGDQVLMRVKGAHRRSKLGPLWDAPVYRVLRRLGSHNPAYEIQRVDGVGEPRVVHRALLKKVPQGPCWEEGDDQPAAKKSFLEVSVPWFVSRPVTPEVHVLPATLETPTVEEGTPAVAAEVPGAPEVPPVEHGSPSLRRSTREGRGRPAPRYLESEFVWSRYLACKVRG